MKYEGGVKLTLSSQKKLPSKSPALLGLKGNEMYSYLLDFAGQIQRTNNGGLGRGQKKS